jgi:hypothetical protein
MGTPKKEVNSCLSFVCKSKKCCFFQNSKLEPDASQGCIDSRLLPDCQPEPEKISFGTVASDLRASGRVQLGGGINGSCPSLDKKLKQKTKNNSKD